MPHECGNLWRQGSEKKGKKGMRPGAVMNLPNVKSCFNPGCTGHDNSHPLAEKSVAWFY